MKICFKYLHIFVILYHNKYNIMKSRYKFLEIWSITLSYIFVISNFILIDDWIWMKFENKFQLGMVRNSFIWNNYSLPKMWYVHWLCIKTLKTTNCGTNNWFFKTKKLNTKINKSTTTNLNVLHFFTKAINQT